MWRKWVSSRKVQWRLQELQEHMHEDIVDDSDVEESNSMVDSDRSLGSSTSYASAEEEEKKEEPLTADIFRNHSLGSDDSSSAHLYASPSQERWRSPPIQQRSTNHGAGDSLHGASADEAEYQAVLQKIIGQPTSPITTKSLAVGSTVRAIPQSTRWSSVARALTSTAVVASSLALAYDVWYIDLAYWIINPWQSLAAVLVVFLSLLVARRERWLAHLSEEQSLSAPRRRQMRESTTHYRSQSMALQATARRLKLVEKICRCQQEISRQQRLRTAAIVGESLLPKPHTLAWVDELEVRLAFDERNCHLSRAALYNWLRDQPNDRYQMTAALMQQALDPETRIFCYSLPVKKARRGKRSPPRFKRQSVAVQPEAPRTPKWKQATDYLSKSPLLRLHGGTSMRRSPGKDPRRTDI